MLDSWLERTVHDSIMVAATLTSGTDGGSEINRVGGKFP